MQVPLGVMLKNENKHEEMICVLHRLMQFVPAVSTEDGVVDPDSGELVSIVSHKFHSILCGGDQLTAERIRGCKRTRSNANKADDKLQGIIPVVEDWHSKVAVLKV